MGKQPRAWTVDFDCDAVVDFEDVKSRGDRKAVFNGAIHHDDVSVVAASSV